MTYLVNEKCIKCKLMDCVEVCPVDCFYEGKNMLVIKPDECIDCGVCEPECPIDAIVSDTEPGSEKWLELNTKYSEIWPNIAEKKDAKLINNKKGNVILVSSIVNSSLSLLSLNPGAITKINKGINSSTTKVINKRPSNKNLKISLEKSSAFFFDLTISDE